MQIRPKYSVIIPVYNSDEVLIELCQRIEHVFTSVLHQSFEIIMVDDCSPNPLTWPRINELVSNHEEIIGIQFTRNFGQHAALICGMTYARGHFIITMDDDLQHQPEDICKLIQFDYHDVVMAQFRKKRHSPIRNFGSYIKSHFDHAISGKPVGIRVTSYCLMQRSVSEKIVREISYPLPLLSVLLFNATKDVIGVEVEHCVRKHGKSGYTMGKLVRMFTGVFYKPRINPVGAEVPFSVRTALYKHQNLI